MPVVIEGAFAHPALVVSRNQIIIWFSPAICLGGSYRISKSALGIISEFPMLAPLALILALFAVV